MKTPMYCYIEGHEKMALPAGVPGFDDAFDKWLDPDRTAVIEIDMHSGHVGPDDGLTLATPRARARIPAHNRFQAECRSLGIPMAPTGLVWLHTRTSKEEIRTFFLGNGTGHLSWS